VYLAPEIAHGSNYDERIDMWGLSCIMAEMLTDKDIPFFAKRSI
jgi:serine/threonine protein kinase